MYICIYVWMYVCMYARTYLGMYACTYACMHMYACLHVCIILHDSACMHGCMHAWMYACLHGCMHACLSVCMHACMYVYDCIRVCVCRCIYAGAQYLHMLPHVFQNHILHYTPNWYHCQFQALDKKCTAKLLRMLQFCGNLQDPVWMLQEVSRPTVTFCSSNVYTDIHSIVDDSPW